MCGLSRTKTTDLRTLAKRRSRCTWTKACNVLSGNTGSVSPLVAALLTRKTDKDPGEGESATSFAERVAPVPMITLHGSTITT